MQCLRGFSNSFPSDEIKNDDAMNLQYIESGALERTWRAARRQRLRQQEDRIWQEFVQEQDDVLQTAQGDPYQFLEQLPAGCLKELLETELYGPREGHSDKHEGGDSPRDNRAVVSFTEMTEDRDSEMFQIYSDGKEEDNSGPELEEDLNESVETVRERDTIASAGGDGGGSDLEHTCTAPISKPTDPINRILESSIYCSKVKDLRVQIQEEFQAMVVSLAQLNISWVEVSELRSMCKRSAEFCSRFHRIHMYQLQRQMHAIKRHALMSLPLGKHTQYQAQMARVLSLHQGLLQALQVFHKSFEQTACLRESCEQLRALAQCARDVTSVCAAIAAPVDCGPARDLYTDKMEQACASAETAVKVYSIRVSSYVASALNFGTARTEKASTKTATGKKRTWSRPSARGGGNANNKMNAKLSMYSLVTVRKPKRADDHAACETAKQAGEGEGNACTKTKPDAENDGPKTGKRKSRRPLMRDPHEGCPRPRQRRQPDQDITTMVEVVESTSSHVSLSGGPPSPPSPVRRRQGHPQGPLPRPPSPPARRPPWPPAKAKPGPSPRKPYAAHSPHSPHSHSPHSHRRPTLSLSPHRATRCDTSATSPVRVFAPSTNTGPVRAFGPPPTLQVQSGRREKRESKESRPPRESPPRGPRVPPLAAWSPSPSAPAPRWKQPPPPLSPLHQAQAQAPTVPPPWSPPKQPLWQPPPMAMEPPSAPVAPAPGAPGAPAAPAPGAPMAADHTPRPDKQPHADKNKKNDAATPGDCEVSRLLRQLCGGDSGVKTDRVSGAKNAQLHCVTTRGCSPRQPSTPQLLRILEETIQKKAPKPMYQKAHARDADRMRLAFNTPAQTSDNIFKYRTKFLQHMLTSPLYANSAIGKPWEMIGSVSEQIIDDLLIDITKEMELGKVVEELYLTEIQ